MSTSKLGYEEPRAIPASPPMRTKSTSCSSSARMIGFGWNSVAMSSSTVAEDEVREADPVVDAVRDGSLEVLTQERAVVAVVDRLRVEGQFFAQQIEQGGERFDGRGDEAALDAGDGGLAGAGASG